MKQIIPFVKDVSFNTRINEITSIALEHNLQMENNDSVVGTFIISGKYKINDISVNEESFENKIDFDITLDDKYDASKVEMDIDNFYYEIINDEILRVHIDVLVDNLTYYNKPIIEPKSKEIVDIDDALDKDIITDNERNNVLIDDNEEEVIEMTNEEVKTEDKKESTTIELESNFLGSEEKYSTYKVHIIRENESIETVIEKYNVSKEIMEEYNNLDNIVLGSKLIIPITNE